MFLPASLHIINKCNFKKLFNGREGTWKWAYWLPLSWQHLVKQTVQAHTQNFSALLSGPQTAGGGPVYQRCCPQHAESQMNNANFCFTLKGKHYSLLINKPQSFRHNYTHRRFLFYTTGLNCLALKLKNKARTSHIESTDILALPLRISAT